MLNKLKSKKGLLAIFTIGFFVLSIFPNNGSGSKKYTNAVDPSRNNYVDMLWDKISHTGAGLSEEVFSLALKGFSKLQAQNKLSKDSILAIVDFSKSSKEKRLYVLDLKTQTLIFNSLVSHGRNSGEEFARYFSNAPNSHKSSLGFYITKSTYQGNNGYSLRLEGIEKGFNDLAEKRAIVVHGAPYAEDPNACRNTYLGRSYGCPSVPMSTHKKIIESIRGGNCLFIYYPDQQYLDKSEILNG
ncbi:MAG: hypothetical protein RI965_945 [Bacteroidota bacterium]|jgi:hypothetical protein